MQFYSTPSHEINVNDIANRGADDLRCAVEGIEISSQVTQESQCRKSIHTCHGEAYFGEVYSRFADRIDHVGIGD